LKLNLITKILAFVSLFSLSNAFQDIFDYENEINKAYNEISISFNEEKKTRESSYLSKINQIKENIEKSKRVNFIVKDYKKIDIYVREEYSIIDNKYVMKRPPSWRKILIKEKNIWE